MQLETVVLTYVVNAVWQAPLVVGAAWIAARAVHGLGPRAEHRVWVLALAAQSALPALSMLAWDSLRAWLASILAGGAGGSDRALVAVQQGGGAAASGFALQPWALHTAALLYGVTLAYFAMRLVWQLFRLRALRHETRELSLDGEAADMWARCANRYHVGHAQLVTSDRVGAPVTIGVRRPLVVLPVALASELGGAERETVLAHECAHIARRDFAKNLAYEMAALPLRWHPAVWAVRARLTETREMVCDALAAESTGRMAYGRSLIHLATRLAEGTPARVPLATGIFDTDGLEKRIMRLTEAKQMVTGARRAAMVTLCVALGASTCALGVGLRLNVAGAVQAATKTGAVAEVPAAKMAESLLHKETPVYPVEAKKKHIQGTVVLKARIGKDGTVQALHVVSGPKQLQPSALDSVKNWTYKPYLLNGVPVEVDTTVNIIYSLTK